MNSEQDIRLYEMEVAPPAQVWSNLSALLDEINEDNKAAARIQNIEILPGKNAWENINASIEAENNIEPRKKSFVFSIKRLAIAAAVIGLIVTAWVFINNRKDNTQIASAPDVKQNVSIPDQITDTNLKSNTDEKIIPEIISSANQNIPAQPFNKLIVSPSKIKKERTQTLPVLLSINTNKTLNDEKTGEKIFTGPIDDLSLIAANDNYFTMVNSNGRMVKIPAHLAHLAPRLQDKPITEDYYEILYGEGAYWKDKVSEWRKRLADSPATSGDMFSNAVELLKSAQNN